MACRTLPKYLVVLYFCLVSTYLQNCKSSCRTALRLEASDGSAPPPWRPATFWPPSVQDNTADCGEHKLFCTSRNVIIYSCSRNLPAVCRLPTSCCGTASCSHVEQHVATSCRLSDHWGVLVCGVLVSRLHDSKTRWCAGVAEEESVTVTSRWKSWWHHGDITVTACKKFGI